MYGADAGLDQMPALVDPDEGDIDDEYAYVDAGGLDETDILTVMEQVLDLDSFVCVSVRSLCCN